MAIAQTPSPLSVILAAKTYNAAWFGQGNDSNEAKIQAAINAAVKDGATPTSPFYVFIPANMLPYDASLITFSTSVRMVREGGDLSVFDVQAYGAAGDNITPDQVALNAAESPQLSGGQVSFPRGRYLLTGTVSKLGLSNWVGVPGVQPPANVGYGSVLMGGFNGTLIQLPLTGNAQVNYPGFHGISFHSDISAYPNAIAISSNGNVREIVIEDGNFDGFNTCISGPYGELYVERCFMFNSKYGLFSNGTSDSWFTRCHAGSGIAANANCSGGAGFFIDNANSCTFEKCRGQVQLGGHGFDIRSSTRIMLDHCISDGNNIYGVQIQNSTQISLVGHIAYGNGLTSAKKAGIRIEAISDTFTADSALDQITMTNGNASLVWGPNQVIVQFVNSGGALPAPLVAGTEYYLFAGTGGAFKIATTLANAQNLVGIDLTTTGSGTNSVCGVTRNIRIIGGVSYDPNMGGAAEQQNVGVLFIKTALNGAAAPFIRDVTIDGMDLSHVATALTFTNHVDSGLRILNCPGVRDDALGASSDATWRIGEQASNVLFNNPLAADVNITCSQDGAYPGAKLNFTRGVGATGAFNLNIKNSAGTTLAAIPASATLQQMVTVVYVASGINQWTLFKSVGG